MGYKENVELGRKFRRDKIRNAILQEFLSQRNNDPPGIWRYFDADVFPGEIVLQGSFDFESLITAIDNIFKSNEDEPLPTCPFNGPNDLRPEDPCPVCGDVGLYDVDDFEPKISNCIDDRYRNRPGE
jgi:hypothetical protein